MSSSAVPLRDRAPRWAHPVTGAVLTALPALVALLAWAFASAGDAGGRGAAAFLAYLSMGTIAGFSVSGST